MAEHLTDKLIENFPVERGTAKQVRDDEQPGFAVRIRVTEAGRRSAVFVWDRVRNGTRHYEKLGPMVPKVFGVREARKRAEELNGDLARNEVTGTPRSNSAPTIEDAWLAYRKREVAPRLRPRTIEGYDTSAAHFNTRLGWLRIARLNVDDAEKVFYEVTEAAGPRAANGALDLLGRVYRDWAARARHRESDPTQVIRRHVIEPREFVFDADDVKRFFAAADADPMRDLWLLLAFTGVRRNNALQAHRDQFDLDRMTWTIPAEAAKGKREIVVQITDEVADIVRRGGDGWLFPARRGDGPLVNIKQDWNRVRESAGLPKWTPHTLRKLHATVARSAGLTQGQIADLLGHRALASQSAYAFGTAETVRAAVEIVAGELKGLAAPEKDEAVDKQLTPNE